MLNKAQKAERAARAAAKKAMATKAKRLSHGKRHPKVHRRADQFKTVCGAALHFCRLLDPLGKLKRCKGCYSK